MSRHHTLHDDRLLGDVISQVSFDLQTRTCRASTSPDGVSISIFFFFLFASWALFSNGSGREKAYVRN